ncbi:MAG: prepilin peptidase, partial [Planctomycetota bacterium]
MGLCVGSFLNAVIYRLPRGRSLRNPLWSFCPNCKRRIRWYDNLPVLSFVWLRGRCRHCHVPIATRYVVIELSMAMIVLMLVDAFFVSGVRSGIKEATFGLTDQLAADWPILLAHIILFACLLPMAVIDLEHYWVDVRFTSLATAAGFVLHTLWTPKHSMAWPRPGDTLAVMSVFALVGLALLWLAVICWPRVEGVSDEHGESEAGVGEGVEPTVRHPPPPLVSPTRAAGWILGLVTVGLFVLMWIEASGIRDLKHTGRALIPLFVFLVLIVREGLETRDADEQIAEAIHEERGESRR